MVTMLKREFFLSEILGRKVFGRTGKVGRLSDLVIVESARIPEVTHLIVSRSFGYPPLLVPWDKVLLIHSEIVTDIDDPASYEKSPSASGILLKDHILDKKILDIDDHEVEVVYDIQLEFRNDKLYVTKVDFSRHALLRRFGLQSLAKLSSKRSEESMVSWAYVQPLPEHLGSFSGDIKLNVLKENIREIHPVDLADILEEVNQEQRLAIFNQLDDEQAVDTLEEVEPRVQRELIHSLRKERAAELINDMSPAQAADILAILPAEVADELLLLIDKDSAAKVQKIIDEHDQDVLHYATRHLIKVSGSKLVKEIVAGFRNLARDKDVIMYIYVTDPEDKLLGVVDLREIMQAPPEERLDNIMTTHVISLHPGETLREASDLFTRYDFDAIPVVDDGERLLGVVRFRDIKGVQDKLL